MTPLNQFDLVYLATPYSKYPKGIDQAYIDAANLAARLLRLGVKVYSPITHTHPIAIHGGLNPLDHEIWLPFNRSIMKKSDALLVVKMDSWQDSYGIAEEIKAFTADCKPIMYLNPETMEVV